MEHIPEGEVCHHAFDDGSFRVPKHTDKVCRDECAYCCNTSHHPGGVFVCAQCFVGCCPEHVGKHLNLEPNHKTYIRIEEQVQYPEQEPKITDINDISQIGAVPPKQTNVRVYCADCGINFKLGADFQVAASTAATAIVNADAPTNDAQASAAANWGLDDPCKHCSLSGLQQIACDKYGPGKAIPTEREPCANCDCAKNNWMCLTCGAVGCPRKEAGGREHAMLHFMMTGHPLVVKLGTVTPVRADIHCYACTKEIGFYSDMQAHLRHFGVEMQTAVKTAKSLAEMQLDNNLKHEYDQITEEGSKLVPLFGPGLTGLENFGNTCYIASILQTLVATPPFARRFAEMNHIANCKRSQPLSCFECQIERIVKGMLSGKYSIPPPPASSGTEANVAGGESSQDGAATGENYRERKLREDRNGIAPKLFKQLVAGSNSEWQSKSQQDAEEYLSWLMEALRNNVPAATGTAAAAANSDQQAASQPLHPGQLFRYIEETRRECSACHAVRYDYQPLDSLKLNLPIDPPPPSDPTEKISDEEREARRKTVEWPQMARAYLAPSVINDARCPHCKNKANLTDTRRIATFPDFLAVKACREFYCRVTNTVRKHDAKVMMPIESLDLAEFVGRGFQEGAETWMSQEIESNNNNSGKNSSSNNQQQGQAKQKGGLTPQPNAEMVANLVAMDFPEAKVRWALHKTNNDPDMAIGYIFDHTDEPTAADLNALDGNQEDAAQQQQQQQAPATDNSNNNNNQQDGAAKEVDKPTFPDKRQVGSDGPPGRYELYAMVSHMGQNATSGHWVAHVRHPQQGWVIFNDAKVAKSENPPVNRSTLYFYRRV